MKEYIASFHGRPRHHKKRFALIAAGAITVIIFSFWSAIKFSAHSTVADNADGSVNLAAANAPVSPFGDILHGIKSSWESIMSISSNLSNNGK